MSFLIIMIVSVMLFYVLLAVNYMELFGVFDSCRIGLENEDTHV